MKILILDDMKLRHNTFAKTYAGHSVTHAYTFREFAAALVTGGWDLIHLDHDLGDERVADTYLDGWGNTREYTGLDAAREICSLEDGAFGGEVIIHSINPTGAAAMRQSLERRGIPVRHQPYVGT